MATVYPLTLPATSQFKQVTLRRRLVASVATSPFTYQRQVQLYPGERWESEISLVPMRQADYERWNAFLLALDGPVGTFLMGDPMGRVPCGAARFTPGAPVVDGAGQTGESLAIRGLPASVPNYLRAGDYVQLGSGASARLYKLVADANSDGAGKTALTLRPRVKTASADGAVVVVSNALGRWALVGAEHHWTVDATGLASITFAAQEPR